MIGISKFICIGLIYHIVVTKMLTIINQGSFALASWTLLQYIENMQQHVFWNIIYHRGHHWKVMQIVCTSFMTLNETISLNVYFFTTTNNFIIITRLATLLFHSIYFLQDFYFVYLFTAALCRLLLELNKLHCSINWFFTKLAYCKWHFCQWKYSI